MKLNHRIAIVAVLMALLCATAGARWQDKAAQPTSSAPAAAAKSSPEMDKLKFYVGEWDYTETYGKTPAFPNGGKNSGVYSSKLGPGGNSLVNHFHSQGPVGDFEGMLVITWDPKEKAYKEYVFSGEAPGAIVMTGQWDGDTLTFRSELTMGNTKIAFRNTAQVVGAGKLVTEQFYSAGGAPEVSMVRVEATKR